MIRAILGGVAAAAIWVGAASAQTLIVGNKAEHTLSFIDLESGEEVARRETGKAPHEIAVSPDGSTAVVVSYRMQDYEGNTLHVFDVASARKTGEISLGEQKGPHGLKWIPGTDRVIVTTEITEDVAIVDIALGEVVGSVKTGQQGSHMVALSPDAKTAYVGNIGSGGFSVIDLQNQTKLRDVKAGEGTEAVTVTPDGREIWVGNNETRSIMAFDADTFDKIADIKTDGVPIRVESSPDGALIAVSLPDRSRVDIYDRRTREKTATVDLAAVDARLPVTMLYSPVSNVLWVAATASASVVEIDMPSWRIIRTLSAGEGSDGLGFSPVRVVGQHD